MSGHLLFEVMTNETLATTTTIATRNAYRFPKVRFCVVRFQLKIHL
jgi:hypothetical protein